MWQYSQSSGILSHADTQQSFLGYSGAFPFSWKDYVINKGPIPLGKYSIGAPVDHTRLGPLALPLTPDPNNAMHGRSDFYCHGDDIHSPSHGSDGCIVMAMVARQAIIDSKDYELEVIA